MIELWPEQVEVIEEVRGAIRNGYRSILVVMPCGSGKTILAASIIHSAEKKQKRSIFLAHRRELIYQTADKLNRFGVQHGIIMAGERTDHWVGTQIASIDTLRARYMNEKRKYQLPLPNVDLVFTDECFTGDAEILTSEGFVRFDQLKKNTPVAQWDNGRISFVVADRYVDKPYSGEMVRLHSHKLCDLTMTPAHEILVDGQRGLYKTPVSGLICAHYNRLKVAGAASGDDNGPLTPTERIQIALQADGYMCRYPIACPRIDFTFAKQRKIDRLFSIVYDGGWKLVESTAENNKRRFLVYGVEGATKNLWDVFNISTIGQERAAEIIEAMVQWDGHICARQGMYYFSSVDESAVDFYQAVALLAGYKTNKTKQVDERSDTYNDIHRLFISKKTDFIGAQALKRETVQYHGNVYCVSVPSGNIVVRGNGKPMVIGNCHRSLSPTYTKLLDHYKETAAISIGLTATPIRGDGKGLARHYDYMVLAPSMEQLITNGRLVPPRYFAPTIPDLTGVRQARGDYVEGDLEKVMDTREAVGDIVTNWLRIAPERKTIVFCSGVGSSIHTAEQFTAAGIRAAHIDGKTPLKERSEAVAALEIGDIQVLTNCMVFTEGFDCPSLDCCILARPTRNLGLYLQMGGRVLRTFPGKKDSIIIDHSGNLYEHGYLEDDHGWQLTESEACIDNEKRQEEFDKKEPITCVECGCVYEGQLPCPSCGHVPKRKGKYIDSRHADLIEIRREKREKSKEQAKAKLPATQEEKQRWYSMFCAYAASKGHQMGSVAHKYKAKFGVWPKNMHKCPVTPTKECLAYIQHLNIKHAYRNKQVGAYTNEGSWPKKTTA